MSERTIVILIDALGASLCGRLGFRPAGLERSARLRTVLGFSQAALTTIFTGLAPADHGLWMMYSFRRSGGPFRWMRILPPGISARRLWVRRLLAWNLGRVHGVRAYYSLYDVPREVFPYLDLPARRDLFAPGGAAPARTLLDELAARGTPARVWDYRQPEERSFAELEEAAARPGERFLLLYTAGLDADLHRGGSADPRVAARLDACAARIARVVAAAGRAGGARVFVLGDHGMCDVRGTVDVMGPVGRLGLAVGRDYLPFYDSTMARFRTFSERVRGLLADALASAPAGRLLREDELRSLGVHFPDGRFGDLVYLADAGVVIEPGYMGGEERVAAMHGYHPSAPDMASVVLSNVDLPGGEIDLANVAELLVPGFVPDAGGKR